MSPMLSLPAPSLRAWLTAGLSAMLTFGACWTGAIVYWRGRAGDPGAVELLLLLLILPGSVLVATLYARKRLADAPSAPHAAPAHAATPAPARAQQPLAMLATAVRSPHGTTIEEVAAALETLQARPALDTDLVDPDGFPLLCARCKDAGDAADRAAIAAWSAAHAATVPWRDEDWRALVLGTQVARELAAQAVTLLAQDAATPLQLAPVLPADWDAVQRNAAGAWLRHVVEQAGWPADRIVMASTGAADQVHNVPLSLLSDIATPALVIACASHVGAATVQAWSASDTLLTASHPRGRVPGEGGAGLLLVDQYRAAALDGALYALMDPPAGATHAQSADDARGTLPPVLADLARDTLAAARLAPAALTTIVADTGAHTSRMLELMGYAQSATPHLDDQQDIVPVGRASGACGAVPAFTALALARHYACDRNGPVLWLANDDARQRCAATIRLPDCT